MKRIISRMIMLSAAFVMVMTCAVLTTRTAHAATARVEINSKNFPNQNLRKALKAYDEDGDGYLVISEVKSLDVADKGISNLKGISYFTKLKELIVSDNKLTALDLRKNTALTELYCDGNQLTTINLEKNTKIVTLQISSNQLTGINLEKNTKLTTLNANNNQLKSVDFSRNTALSSLDLSGNQLTSLNL
ncbi:MAG: leucine-rich repeat domain-containing protein, partial [Eubacterium sp.]|nr:leucine-rich repeat domain-containing protein [Eubacterium sp.]